MNMHILLNTGVCGFFCPLCWDQDYFFMGKSDNVSPIGRGTHESLVAFNGEETGREKRGLKKGIMRGGKNQKKKS